MRSLISIPAMMPWVDSHSTVPGCYIDILIARISADESDIIVGFEYLARPTMLDFIDPPEPLTRPFLQCAQVLVRIVVLSSLVVFSTHDENL
jgi:hypothetical protein